MTRPILTAAALILTLLSPGPGSAQERWPMSVELGVGRGTGSASGLYKSNQSGFTADALLALRLREAGPGSLVSAVGIAMQGTGAVTDECILRPDGSCIEEFPAFGVASAMLGWETPGSAFRLLTGPGYVVTGDGAFALQARADAFLPLVGRLGIGLSARGMVVPGYDGESFRVFGGQVGLRVR